MDNTVVAFTNIDTEDFGAETWKEVYFETVNGVSEERYRLQSVDNAIWDGTPYSVKAGETKFYPQWLALHLAKHLIKKIAGKKKRSWREEGYYKELQSRIISEPEVHTAPRDAVGDVEASNAVSSRPEEPEAFADLSLESKSFNELKAIAKERGVKVTNTTKKEDLLKALNS